LLARSALSEQQIEAVINSGEFVSYEYTGCGYFLGVKHPSLPQKRVVCSKPIVVGDAGSVPCGFVIFIENGRLTLECHSWGTVEVPENFREQSVQVKKSDAQLAVQADGPASDGTAA